MYSLLLTAALCAPIKLVNFSIPLTDVDKSVIAHTKKTCKMLYPKSPCVKEIIKDADKNHYSVTCSGELTET